MSLISVAKEDLSVGIPLPWTVYDQDRNVLMEEGSVLESEDRLQSLLASNPLRELSWNSAAPAASPESREASGIVSDEEFAATSKGGFTFKDMRLRVGDRIQLQPPATVSYERFVVKLIGYLENTSLLVTAPMVNGLRLELRPNDKIVARVFSSQKAFGFNCFVERVCKIPYDYLHLSFPKEIQGSVIRKSPRVRTKIIASVATPDAADSGDRQSAVIVNLSADGALVKGRKPLRDKGETIQLSFRVNLHNVDAYLTVDAVIRSVFGDEEKESGKSMFNHGVQFQNLQPNDSVILQSLIYQQIIEHPHTLA